MADAIPLDRVHQLKAQNYPNSQIIDILQKDGFSSSQIFDAINQSEIGDGGPAAGQGLPPAHDDFPPVPSLEPAPAAPAPASDLPPMPGLPEAPPGLEPEPLPAAPDLSVPAHAAPSTSPAHHALNSGDVSTEEYVEAIIDEKWTDLENDIQKVVDWKNRSEQTITQMQQQFTDLKDRFEKLHEALIGKIESYDKNIMEVGAELKAMEKVFGKVLPVFTDNVKQLNDITDRMDRHSK